jgi:hypothetical protein
LALLLPRGVPLEVEVGSGRELATGALGTIVLLLFQVVLRKQHYLGYSRAADFVQRLERKPRQYRCNSERAANHQPIVYINAT